MASRLHQLARDTPASRDRYVDFLRAVSILAVVFGHWVSALIERDGGLVRVTGVVGPKPSSRGRIRADAQQITVTLPTENSPLARAARRV